MSIDKDDPRLTAYALGEMDDHAERAAFEHELEHSPEARAEVEAIRTVAEGLRAGLAGETTPALTPAQRGRVAKAARSPRRAIPWWSVPAAAALVVGLVLTFQAPDRSPAPVFEARAEREERARVGSDVTVRDAVREGDRPVLNVGTRELSSESAFGFTAGRGDAPGAAASPPPPSDPTMPMGPQPESAPIDAAPLPLGQFPEAVRPPAAVTASAPPGRRAATDPEPPPAPSPGTESYDRTTDNPFRLVAEADTSTFSIDVDTASYANVRRFLLAEGRLPPPDAVRIEEMVNYFDYGYEPPPSPGPHPFAARVETATCPWNPKHRLARIAIQGRIVDLKKRPPTNLVFLLDVSGSMRPADKLPLVRQAMHLLVDQLDEGDTVSIVVYAGAAGLVLPPTTGDRKDEIRAALDRLEAGGSTNGGQGIQLAYHLAEKHFIKGGVNRVILATDGDFNVGISDRGSLTRLIEQEAKTGVFLSVLGVGTGNLKDAMMEELSNKGNGNYAYLDSLQEARKVLVQQAAGTLVTIAKDVKIQVFFNPRTVAAYRLIGYENRILAKEDFNDDTKDAGEIGAGHSVTALYEIVPAGADVPGPKVDANPFVAKPAKPAGSPVADLGALFRLRLRYKQPEGDTSTLMEEDIRDSRQAFHEATGDFQWAASVASFGMILRGSPYRGQMATEGILEIARAAVGADEDGHRAEFLKMVEAAQRLGAR